LQASAKEPDALRAAVEREVGELERLCRDMETYLVAGDWNSAGNALRDSRRATHAFLNAMEAAAAFRDEAFDAGVHARLRRVFDVRQDQLQRLEQFHEGVGSRLQTISKFKMYARSVGKKRPPLSRLGLDRTR
jgi:hypothetical protein